ncbi:MAG: NADH-quinone oxidoreductase subunit H [Candidatus Accumulibacter sp.]|jgi:formate hydrogenlyase subunit 4|nr:NADH-quinone oxidoreductase subunit H [Accumulibacter sp.]
MNFYYAIFAQLIEMISALLLAPLFAGWVNQCRAWLQNRSAPPLLQTYYTLHKLFHKDVLLAHNASPLFRAAPYAVFACMVLASGIVPTFSTTLVLADAADAIAFVGLFALARVFIALAAMDVGTAFGSLGSRREMLIGFLAEPALLMIFFTASLISHSTSLSSIVGTLARTDFIIYPSLAFAGTAFVMVSLAENARVPIDNPTTHLELTMIHEAMILEYSGRHLALIEWASALKLFAYSCLGVALFVPVGISTTENPVPLLIATGYMLGKLVVGGFGLALIETLSAKMRIFRAPEFLGTAFLLAVLAMLVHLLLEAGK